MTSMKNLRIISCLIESEYFPPKITCKTRVFTLTTHIQFHSWSPSYYKTVEKRHIRHLKRSQKYQVIRWYDYWLLSYILLITISKIPVLRKLYNLSVEVVLTMTPDLCKILDMLVSRHYKYTFCIHASLYPKDISELGPCYIYRAKHWK